MGKKVTAAQAVKKARLVFWDFDGVIKESVDVKTKAFVALFEKYGSEMAHKVKQHHEANGGMSRFVKFPIYLQWANEAVTPERINELHEQFSALSFDGVVNAPWVTGAEEYLRNNIHRQLFVVISATPQGELESILHKLNLDPIFSAVYGTPATKKEAISEMLQQQQLLAEDAIMIGDAIADYEAALANKVPFLLRKHTSNLNSFPNYTGYAVDNISEL